MLAASACLVTTSALAQTSVSYHFQGGTFSGSINGTPFTDASITISGVGNTADLINGFVPIGPPTTGINYTFLPFTPTATISDGITTYSMTILNEAGRTWAGITFDSAGFLGYDLYAIGWMGNPAVSSDGTGFEVQVIRTGSFPSPTGPASLVGAFALSTTPETYQTSLGPLVLTRYTDNSATLTISQVPEASTWIPAGIVLSLGVFTLARRQQHNRPQA